MGKKKKPRTEEEKFYSEVAKPQNYEQPQGEKPIFTKAYSYLFTNQNFIKASSSAKVLYFYMKDWAYKNKEFRKTREFDFSITLLDKLGVMTAKTCGSALKELEHYHFIKKANNATFQSGITQKWAFDDGWYKQEFPTYKK